MNNSSNSFSKALLNWFDHHGRHDLPWQINKTPYRVWISEIMLQQTQVKTVIPYYEKFMASFPQVEDLANASEDDVLSHWAGLGYYARARNMHKAAKICVETFDGELPSDSEELQTLPGIGRSTAAAILSISQNQTLAILDGNVKRVLCRYLGVKGWPGTSKVEKTLWQHAEALTPSSRTGDYTQAIMDFGATLCTRSKPNCQACPFSADCEALKQDLVLKLPESKPKKSIPTKQTSLYVLMDDEKNIYLEKRPAAGIWGGLWSLPEKKPDFEHQPIELEPFRHTFSHFHLEIQPILVSLDSHSQIDRRIGENSSQWTTIEQAKSLGIPAAIKKILQDLP